jgi:hypothetical protein
MTAYVAKPPMKSAVLFGWEDRNGLVPVIDGDWMKKKKKLRSYVIIFISISRYC